jgi:signal transduction histidine kinase
MTSLRAHPLPATLFGLCFVMTATAYVLMALNWLTPGYQPTAMEIWWFATWPAMFLAYPIVGALIAARHPRNTVGWLFCALGLLWSLGFLAAAYAGFGLKAHPGAVPGAMAADWFESWSFFPGLGLALIYAPLLFPNGRPLGPRWRVVAWTGAVGILLTTAVFAFEPGPLDDGIGGFPNPYGILSEPLATGLAVVGFPLTFGSAVAAATSMAIRLRRSRGVEREQLKWIAFAAAILAVAFACHLALQFSGLADRVEWYGALWGLALCGLPIAAGIAILRRGLFDIDVIIGRTLVYTTLTGIVVGGYVAIVAGAGALLQQRGGLVLPLAATGLVAVAFQPLRDRLQRGVNRLLYGDRDDPYAVLSRLGQRLESALAPDDILPVIVQTMTDALRLPYAAIVLPGAVDEPAAAAGHPVDAAIRLPLHYRAEPVGELVVAPRGPGEAFGPADRRLLEDLARQIGVAAHAVQLTADLQRSRRRIVTAREEERRRLRRDLHDGLGAQLAALSLQAGALRLAIAADPTAAQAQAAELRTELRAAVADIRRLVHGLRPPAIDELGLVGALRERTGRFQTSVSAGDRDPAADRPALAVCLIAPEAMPPLPAAVEVAVYRIVEEALSNVGKHAQATRCLIRLEADRLLTLTVEDDGAGLPADRGIGVGLISMRERAEELGGTFAIGARDDGSGARLVVRLPLPPREE